MHEHIYLNGGDLGGIEPVKGIQQKFLEIVLLLLAGDQGLVAGRGLEGRRGRGILGRRLPVEGLDDGGGGRGRHAGVAVVGGGRGVKVQRWLVRRRQ